MLTIAGGILLAIAILIALPWVFAGLQALWSGLSERFRAWKPLIIVGAIWMVILIVGQVLYHS